MRYGLNRTKFRSHSRCYPVKGGLQSKGVYAVLVKKPESNKWTNLNREIGVSYTTAKGTANKYKQAGYQTRIEDF